MGNKNGLSRKLTLARAGIVGLWTPLAGVALMFFYVNDSYESWWRGIIFLTLLTLFALLLDLLARRMIGLKKMDKFFSWHELVSVLLGLLIMSFMTLYSINGPSTIPDGECACYNSIENMTIFDLLIRSSPFIIGSGIYFGGMVTLLRRVERWRGFH